MRQVMPLLAVERADPPHLTSMSAWHVSASLASVFTPLSFLSVLLILRHKNNPARVHAVILTLLFLAVQYPALFHPTPSIASKLRHHQFVYATLGAATYFIATIVICTVIFCVVIFIGMLFIAGVVLATNGETPVFRVPEFARDLFQEFASRLNVNSYNTVSTTTRFMGADGVTSSTTTTTITNRDENPIETPNSQYSGIADRLACYAKPIITTAFALPLDVVNTITSFVIIPSRTLLLMDSSGDHGSSDAVSNVIRLGIAGAVGLWYTVDLLSSIWTGGSLNNVSSWTNGTSNNMSKAVGDALKRAWWFLLSVMAQVYVTASILQREMTQSGPGALKIGWIVLLFRAALRLMESIQQHMTERWRPVNILLEAVKGCFVIYFGMRSWEALSNLLSVVASKQATA